MLSPGVSVKEKDLTFNINSIDSNSMAMLGVFRWGPVDEIVPITTNESEVLQKFGTPDTATSMSFQSAANYLKYVNPLYIIRAVQEDVALNAVANGQSPVLVKNESQYEQSIFENISFIARYPGELGNSLKVSISGASTYSDWMYADQFEYNPAEGEFNVVVIDEDGQLSGNKGSIVEKYELMTFTKGAKKPNGTSADFEQVLQDQSSYILVGDVSAITLTGTTIDPETEEEVTQSFVYETSLTGGVDGNDIQSVNFSTGVQLLANKETLDIIGMFASGAPSAVVTSLIDTAESRGDCVAFVAPELDDVYNARTPVENLVEYFDTTINKNNSYAFYVDNWKMVIDNYSNSKVWIPCDSDAAALTARVYAQNEAWYSPAGLNRGQLKNIVKLAWSADEKQRNVLYKSSINSIVSFTGEGTILFGDKTALKRPSAFSRINVRNLFIVMKKSIARSARYQLFEFNDEITRSTFKNATDRYLEQVQGRRGIEEKKVVCDETNNPAQVRNANEFVGDIAVKPNKSINFISLNFIAVDSGVSFEEIEGA